MFVIAEDVPSMLHKMIRDSGLATCIGMPSPHNNIINLPTFRGISI